MEKQLPVMQRPGYVYRARKHVLARRVQPGDVIQDRSRTDPITPSITVASIEVREHLTYATFEDGKCYCLGSNESRVWVDRAEKGKR